MTEDSDLTSSQGTVSRVRYERERLARTQAEELLETKSRELFDANTALRGETEALREALDSLDKLRTREAAALRETEVLFATLGSVTAAGSADQAVASLLAVMTTQFAADATLLLSHDETGQNITVGDASDGEMVGLSWPDPGLMLTRPRRLTDLTRCRWATGIPDCLRGYRGFALVPFIVPDEPDMALAFLSCRPAAFSAAALRIMCKAASGAAPAIHAAKMAHRNALLADVISGDAAADIPGASVLDAPLEAVNRAFLRLTHAQGRVVGIVNMLLSAPIEDTDSVINAALADLGKLSGMDHVYVGGIAEGNAIHFSHTWSAPHVANQLLLVQALSADLVHRWHATFETGDTVHIAEVSQLADDCPEKPVLDLLGIGSILVVPMMQNMHFYGFMGYDSRGSVRSFLPGEVYLIRSVANVIATVLERRATTAGIAAANAALTEERNRMQSTLAAMPDLLLEIDRDGRFMDFHSGLIPIPDQIQKAFQYRLLEEVLPPEMATEGRRILRELDETGHARGVQVPFDFGSGPVLLDLTATRMGETGYLFVLRDITEARKQQSEIERLSEVARRTSNLVVVTDTQSRIEWVNAAFERSTGFTMAEVIGRVPGHFLQNDHTDPATVAKIRKAIAKGEEVQVEILNETKEGREYWLSVDIQPLHDPDGALRGFMAIQTDITERRLQEEILRLTSREAIEARQTLVSAVTTLQDAFALYDADDRLVICNERYRSIYPLSAPAIMPGATFESIVRYGLLHGEFAEALGREDDWLAERMAQHRKSESELEQQLADGRWLRIIEKATPDGGRVGLRVDVTALKKAERQAVTERAEAMAASRDGISITDGQGLFTYMNDAHLTMFGYDREDQVIGRPWSSIYSPDNARWMEQNAMPILFSTGSWRGEVAGVDVNGKPVEQEVSLTLKADNGILSITRDISQRRLENEERLRLREDLNLAQRREAIGEMAAGLAHDFNNLLATISGTASLIEELSPPDSLARSGATRIQAAGEQAATLVKRLLTLGTRPVERSLIDLRDPVREAADLVRSSIRAPAEMQLNLPATPLMAEADPTDILQVVMNLAINARDALNGEAGQIAISLTEATAHDLEGPFAIGAADPARRHLCLTVADNGLGMSPDVAVQIFKPYFSTKGSKGTGLGLAIVSTVVNSNDGALRLETAPGKGTSFHVLWPIDATAPAVSLSAAQLTGRLDGKAILFVDDQEDVLGVLTKFLEQAGAEVAPASDPRDALEVILEDPTAWDLVITDFDMPGMNGAEFARAIRKATATLPIVLVTALPGWKGRSGKDGAPFAAVLGKPVTREALVTTAEAAIASNMQTKGS
ncbi:MAG: PAS domain S-box protein [Rhodobacterales bacterium]|nr:PAS domain S-box protein [Rhodobacterales bacterium]